MNPTRSQTVRPAPALAAYLLGSLDFDVCLALQQRLVYEAGGRQDGQIAILICEHPTCITVGRHGSRADIRLSERSLVTERLAVRWVNRGGGSLMHAPGQLAVYPIVPLEWHGWSVGAYLARLQAGLAASLAELGFQGHAPTGRHGLWGRTGQVASVGIAVKNWTSYYGAYVNVSPAQRLLSFVHSDRPRRAAMSSLAIERQQPIRITRVREALVRHLAAAFDAPRYHLHTGHSLLAPPGWRMAPGLALASLPIITRPDHDAPPSSDAASSSPRLPRWLKRNVPKGNANHFTARLLEELRLETVCENAKCPNRMECYSQKTATFMILGNVCTRPCGFCAVAKGRTLPLEDDEPARVAEAAARLGLKHVVITSVTRDDLADGGADHFHRSVIEVRRRTGAAVEVLTPDFLGKPGAIEHVVASRPEVFNHNTETVPRLYRAVRGRKSDYRWTLFLLRRVKELDPAIHTKSGLMLGLGESRDELLDTLVDLRDAGCDFLTLGQYLQPSPEHLPVVRYVPPAEFDELGRAARQLGFAQVASGPFVRSSYHAREMAEQ